MKTLKFNHELAQQVASGQKTVTWRVNDEKNLSVDDEVWIVDKVERKNPETWQAIGTARINQILAKHLGEMKGDELGGHEEYSSKEAMIKTFQEYYGQDINENTPVKVIHFTFKSTPPKLLNDIEDTKPFEKEVKLFSDGGSRGNPGPSASGYVLMTMDDLVVSQGGDYLGKTTNNQAEYQALKAGMEEALERRVQIIHVFMDSQLVVNQMTGQYRVKHRELLPIYQAIKALEPRFEQITYTHVPREQNKLADAMVNEILDASDLS